MDGKGEDGDPSYLTVFNPLDSEAAGLLHADLVALVVLVETLFQDPFSKFTDVYNEMCTQNELRSFKLLLGNHVGASVHAWVFVGIVFNGSCDNPLVISQASSHDYGTITGVVPC